MVPGHTGALWSNSGDTVVHRSAATGQLSSDNNVSNNSCLNIKTCSNVNSSDPRTILKTDIQCIYFDSNDEIIIDGVYATNSDIKSCHFTGDSVLCILN